MLSPITPSCRLPALDPLRLCPPTPPPPPPGPDSSQPPVSNMPENPTQRLQKLHTQYHSYQDQSGQQRVDDPSPNSRHSSRLPIFRQVRSLLNKQTPPLQTDQISRPRGSSHGRRDQPFDHHDRPALKSSMSALEPRRHQHHDHHDDAHLSFLQSVSPIDYLRESYMELSIPPGTDLRDFHYDLTVSALQQVYGEDRSTPRNVSVSSHASPETPTSGSETDAHAGTTRPRISNRIRRKPAPRATSLASDNVPSLSPSLSPPRSRHADADADADFNTDFNTDLDLDFDVDVDVDVDEIDPRAPRNPTSHFSWASYAPSPPPARPSFDLLSRSSLDRPPTDHSTDRSGMGRPSLDDSWSRSKQTPRDSLYHNDTSRFSWSTINTNIPGPTRPDSPPLSPPLSSASRHKPPPMQSILSRQRPVGRQEHGWNARKSSLAGTPPPLQPASTTTTTTQPLIISNPSEDASRGDGPVLTSPSTHKHLPPPPDMLSPVTPLTHLESLIRREQDAALQRRNVEKAIVENAKMKNASPLDVSFSQLREADKQLDELRARLGEIQLEERDLGIAIARARRKENEEEGLWVRRVTG